MSSFTLPSGRIVQVKERPTWGDIRAATDAGLAAQKADRHYGQAHATELMARMTGLTAADIDEFDFPDEEALAAEVTKRTLPRPESDEVPFVNPSSDSSPEG